MMSNLHSPRWHRVSSLRPQLAERVSVRRQTVRGQTWIVLHQPARGRSLRLNPAAWRLAAQLDGTLSVQALWDAAFARDGEPPTQDELIELLAQLRDAGLLRAGPGADVERLLEHQDQMDRPAGRRTLLAWRIPLGDPARLLARLGGLGRWLFSPAGAAVWALGVLSLLVLAAQHGPTLWAHGRDWLATPRYALLAALVYVPVKLVHELSHGLAVQRWGGSVREAGVTLMLGLPVPYVNASAAAAFVQRRQRVLVGAAGMMAELSLAAIALPLWLWLDPGLARDTAFVVLFVTGVSTLLFNANPLQRLDGYYILSDALDLPNLAPRSRRWWTLFLSRRVLHLPGSEPMPVAPGERPWLVAYAPLSWAMLLLVAGFAVAWLGSVSSVLGLVAALLLGWQVACRPAWRLAQPLRRAALAQAGSARRWRRLGAGAAVLVAAVLLLPLPQRTVLQGVVWPPDQAQLRSEEEGFVQAVLLGDGAVVKAGATVLQLANPRLRAELESQSARVAALEAELFGLLPTGAPAAVGAGEPAHAGDALAELAAAQAALQRLQQRVDALSLRAAVAGRLALPAAADLEGAWLPRGRLVGQVLTGEPATVRVALPEAEGLRAPPTAVGVRLRSDPGTLHTARLLRDGVGAVSRLPSAALGQRHGGAIATDPGDKDGLQTLQPVLLLDVALDVTQNVVQNGAVPATAPRLGERAWVRLDTGWAPLAGQALQALRRRIVQGLAAGA